MHHILWYLCAGCQLDQKLNFILVIIDRFTKLTKAKALPRKSRYCIGRAFTTHFVFKYGIPKTVIADNAEEFTGSFLTKPHHIVICKVITTTTYNPHTKIQLERLKSILLAALWTIVDDHPKVKDIYTDSSAFAKNMHSYSSTTIPPFEMIISRSLALFSIESILHVINLKVENHNNWLTNLMESISVALQALEKEQAAYKRNYERRLRNRHKKFRQPDWLETVPPPQSTNHQRAAEEAQTSSTQLRFGKGFVLSGHLLFLCR